MKESSGGNQFSELLLLIVCRLCCVCERDSGVFGYVASAARMKKLECLDGQVQNVRSKKDNVHVDAFTAPHLHQWLEHFEVAVRNEIRALMCLLRGAKHQERKDEW